MGEHWVLPGGGVSQHQQETHGAPDTQGNEDDGDKGQLPVGHIGKDVGQRTAGHDGPVLRQNRMLDDSERKQEYLSSG